MVARSSGSINRPDTEAQDQPSPNHHFRLATRGRSTRLGQDGIHAVQQNPSFDYLVGKLLQVQRHVETNRFGGFEIYH